MRKPVPNMFLNEWGKGSVRSGVGEGEGGVKQAQARPEGVCWKGNGERD